MAKLGDVRVEESLRVKIGEAKNLPSVTSSGSGPKTCLAIKIDSEEIFRTPAVEKSFDPFFNTEFHGEIPKKFRNLSFYLYDVGNKNKVLGKVCLKKEELYKYHQKEHWFPLTRQDGHSEVQGKVQLEMRMEEYLPASTDSLSSIQRIVIRVLECSDLTVVNGACNPYAVVTLVSAKGKSKEVHRTAVRKKTICPQFDETFFFSYDRLHNQDKSLYRVDDIALGEISVCLFHDDSKVSREVLGNMFKGSFLGEVKIPVRDIDFIKPRRAWYCLQAKESTKTSTQSLGSIRLCINHSADYVFPSKYYDGLRDLILMSPEKKPISSSAAFILGEIVENRLSAAQPLVRLFLHHGKLVTLIHALADWEISNTKDPNTLFRGNSLLTKMVDELMKYLGLPYLHDTLKTVIDKICSENKPCEIDPNRLKDGDDPISRLANLHGYVQEVLHAILDSSLVCPSVMRDVFAKLKAQAIAGYPDQLPVRFHAVTSFVFLRFFTAAILGPKPFDLISDSPDPSVQRTLTLISKAICGVVSSSTSHATNLWVKEEFMVPLFDLFRDKVIKEKIKMFLEIISSSSSFLCKSIEAPIILKEGFMIKRAQGRKRFGRKNFKKRFFMLTNQSLSYSTSKGGKILFEMLITDILAVEKVEEESFKMKYMFQIVQMERTLYIQANNCVEEKEWLDILTKICKSNKNRRTYYHPAAYVHTVNNSHWLCCKCKDQNYVGCTPVTGGLPLTDIQADIDSDREVEKIHSLFLDKMDKLELLQGLVNIDDLFEEEVEGGNEMCGTQAVYAGDLQDMKTQASGLTIEDPPSCYTTVAEIQKCIITLEQEHIQYMRSVQRHTVIGSIDTPIGDESGADLVRNMNRSSDRLSRHGSRGSNASNLSRRSGRGCRSRGGSFRERDRSRSGTEHEGVKKSLSGDVASSGHSLGVDFKQTVKKAASYDTFALDRRQSQDSIDVRMVGGDSVSGGYLCVGILNGDFVPAVSYPALPSNPSPHSAVDTSLDGILNGDFVPAASYSALPSNPSSHSAVDTSLDGLDSKNESLATDVSDISCVGINETDLIYSFNGSLVDPDGCSSNGAVQGGQHDRSSEVHPTDNEPSSTFVNGDDDACMEFSGDFISSNDNVSDSYHPGGLSVGVPETSVDHDQPSLLRPSSACDVEVGGCNGDDLVESDLTTSSQNDICFAEDKRILHDSHSPGAPPYPTVCIGMDFMEDVGVPCLTPPLSDENKANKFSHGNHLFHHPCRLSVNELSVSNGFIPPPPPPPPPPHLPLLNSSSLETDVCSHFPECSNDTCSTLCAAMDDSPPVDLIGSEMSIEKDFTEHGKMAVCLTSVENVPIYILGTEDGNQNEHMNPSNIDIFTSDARTRSEGQDICVPEEVEIML